MSLQQPPRLVVFIFVLAFAAAGGPAMLHAQTDSVGEPSERRAPDGVRLVWSGFGEDSPTGREHQKLVWTTEVSEVEELLGTDCRRRDWSGEQTCHIATRQYGGWWADFGDESPSRFLTTLFFLDGEFFRYFVEVAPADFELVRAALADALGEATNSESSFVTNRLGAQFDQEIRVWEIGEVGIFLVKRAGEVTTGLLSVTFNPLADKIPDEKVSAPFDN